MKPSFDSKHLFWVTCALASLLLCQCGSAPRTTHTPLPTSSNQPQTGVVTSSQPVRSTRVSGVGHALGSIGGAILGSRIGSGHTAHFAGSLAGSLIGGLGGDAAEAGLTKGKRQHITILSEGRVYRVVSNGKHPLFKGDRVQIHTNNRGQVLRVIPRR